MQPLGGAFGGFDAQGLDGMRFEELAALFPNFRPLADAGAGGHHE